VTRCAPRLGPLTFVRPRELRTAGSSHIDLRAAEWCIPAERMQMKEDLIVSLSAQALGVIEE
jgi:integrase